MHFTSIFAVALAAASQVIAAGTAVDQTTFNNIIQYTRFARASYARTCATPTNGSVVLNYINDATTDGHATLFKWDKGKQIVLSLRGTYSPQNFNSDLDFLTTNVTIPGTLCSGCKVHEGFQKIYNAIANPILSAVKSAVAKNPSYGVVVTGHSLGGALASLATAHLGANGVKVAYTYTYGEVRNGNKAWGTYVTSFVPAANYYRVTHANDGVPQLPPAALGFQHHGIEYWQTEIGYNNTAATTLQCLDAFGLENLGCNNAQSPGDWINGAHVTYSNAVIGNVLHIHECGASYP